MARAEFQRRSQLRGSNGFGPPPATNRDADPHHFPSWVPQNGDHSASPIRLSGSNPPHARRQKCGAISKSCRRRSQAFCPNATAWQNGRDKTMRASQTGCPHGWSPCRKEGLGLLLFLLLGSRSGLQLRLLLGSRGRLLLSLLLAPSSRPSWEPSSPAFFSAFFSGAGAGAAGAGAAGAAGAAAGAFSSFFASPAKDTLEKETATARARASTISFFIIDSPPLFLVFQIRTSQKSMFTTAAFMPNRVRFLDLFPLCFRWVRRRKSAQLCSASFSPGDAYSVWVGPAPFGVCCASPPSTTGPFHSPFQTASRLQ